MSTGEAELESLMRTIVDAFVFAFSIRSVCDRFVEQPDSDVPQIAREHRFSNWLRGVASRISLF